MIDTISQYQAISRIYTFGDEKLQFNDLSKNNKTDNFDKPNDIATNKRNDKDKNNDSYIKSDKKLSDEEKNLVEQLKKIEREVKAHELAHIASGGGLIRGGASYTYQTGPDGKQYITAGEVQIDISYDLNAPQATIRKMQQVRQAALAPSDPSPQDRAVANQASKIEANARMLLSKEIYGEMNEKKHNTPNIINSLA